MNQQHFKQVISGQQRGPLAAFTRAFLRILALGYRIIVSFRNRFYTLKLLRSHAVKAAVISVGNITAGGTGKTPLVTWICQHLSKHYQMAILTRGYKTNQENTEGKKPELDDEPALLARACPDVPVVVNPDRVAGAKEAINECSAQILILDDGFQHRRLRRQLDIVTIDASCPFGYDYLLPAGLLREPIESLRRAQAAVVTRSDQVSTNAREDILKTLHRLNPGMVIAQTRHAPTTVQGKGLEEMPAENLKGRRVFAFCGLGNPDGFYQTLRVLGAQLVGTLSLDDHHHCTARELQGIFEQAQRTRADIVLTTEKNWLSLPDVPPLPEIPFGYLGVELAFEAGEKELLELIKETLTDTIS